eukprot:SAG11_NODE_47920_length_126_cov_270.407407_1_plen_32_part_10
MSSLIRKAVIAQTVRAFVSYRKVSGSNPDTAS